MRRCTGLSPSRTSGRARDMMTDIEYSRNERSISSWISMGSTKPSTSVLPSSLGPGVRVSSPAAMISTVPSDVEEPDVLGVLLDEVPAELHVLAHEDRAHLVGRRRLLHVDLEE